ncbi:flagellin N-terminal helical domain-containing protein [Yersinia mollaretii]|uniref:flagellin N-terminal helical domain-containing protein n=1 Tax=Yersinia mollaretii TaxID=33060 RepID=UPI000C1E6D26|nr:flagellin [Yersinia mollaretii]PJE88666.1 flagellin FliC [Yersinia mollaretii]
MMAVINTNILSLTTQNNMNKSQSALGSAIERLSSGQRINSAKDDAAGQAIANRFTSNIKGLTQASRNANDGISLAQTTEGALGEINNNLQRVRELSVQAATGSNSSSDLKSIQDEIQQRLDEIDRVSDQTQFNGVKVLAGNSSMKVQVGANDGETISINLEKIDSKSLGLQGFNVDGAKQASVDDLTSQFKATGTNNFDVGGVTYNTDVNSGAVTKAGAAQYIDAGTGAFSATATTANTASTVYKTTGATTNAQAVSIAGASVGKAVGDKFTAEGMEFTVKTAADANGNGVFSATVDGKSVDFTTAASTAPAGTAATVTTSSALFTSAVGGGLTTKATENNRAATLADLDLQGATKTGSTLTVNGTVYNANSKGDEITNAAGKVMYMSRTANGNTTLINEDAAASQKSTENQLATVDKALAQVDALRSGLGAVQNRFDSAITNLGNTINNLTSARSRIQDADYSTEVSNMSRAQILQQAGTSVLAQANQVPQTVLSLLR